MRVLNLLRVGSRVSCHDVLAGLHLYKPELQRFFHHGSSNFRRQVDLPHHSHNTA